MPPIKIQLVFFFGLTVFIPAARCGGITLGIAAGVEAILGNGDPQFEQTELVPAFSTPQLPHLITAGCGGGVCITRPAAAGFALC